jgi:hypothetical protein
MKNLVRLIAVAVLAGSVFAPVALAESKEKKKEAKSYPLDSCLVSDEKLGADPDMKPYAFVHEGQEIKICCKACKKDFDKEPKKFLTKLSDEVKKAKKDKKAAL